jgi:serralysin
MTTLDTNTVRGVDARAEDFLINYYNVYAGDGNDVIRNPNVVSISWPAFYSGGNGNDLMDFNLYRDGALNGWVNMNGGCVIFGDLYADLETASEGAGDDHIVSSFSRDIIFAGGGNDFVNGQGGDDEILAGAGDDLVLGGEGADIIFGNAGDDVLYGHNPMTLTRSFLTLTTQYNGATDAVEARTMVGNAGYLFADDNAADQLYGGSGNDILIGGGGGDLLDGGTGTDTASYADAIEGVAGNLGTGVGTRGEALGDTFISVENLVGTRFNDSFTGSSVANVLDGGNGDDRLSGGNGNDTLLGGSGNDTLIGGGHDDYLTGGRGRDTLTGGTGADSFIFRNVLDSVSEARDKITDFSRSQGDKINLNTIDARTDVVGNQDFAFRGTSAFSGESGQLRYRLNDTTTTVMADIDGDKVADLVFMFEGRINLTAGDFIL